MLAMRNRAKPLLVALLSATLLGACSGPRPSQLAERIGTHPAVLVKRVRIPSSEPWYSRIASHTWFELREEDGGAWRRVEVRSPSSGVRDARIRPETPFEDQRWDRDIEVLRAAYGPGAGALARAVRERAARYVDDTYFAWPGPNCNSFVERLLCDIPGLTAALDHNAVGRDWAFPGKVGASGTGLGVEVELPLLGIQLGLVEGVELHALGVVAGVGFWPPTIKLPFVPALQLAPSPDPAVFVR